MMPEISFTGLMIVAVVASRHHLIAAALLQATSLSFIVVATQIGIDLGQIDEATGAALIAAGLLSVLIFPLAALTILRRSEPAPVATELGTMTPDAS